MNNVKFEPLAFCFSLKIYNKQHPLAHTQISLITLRVNFGRICRFIYVFLSKNYISFWFAYVKCYDVTIQLRFMHSATTTFDLYMYIYLQTIRKRAALCKHNRCIYFRPLHSLSIQWEFAIYENTSHCSQNMIMKLMRGYLYFQRLKSNVLQVYDTKSSVNL